MDAITPTDSAPIRLRVAVEADGPAITDVWERAVRATHTFLSEQDIAGFLPKIQDEYLPAVEVIVAVDELDRPTGFIGVDGSHIEMLFVDPDLHRSGIGTALLERVIRERGALTVDVNEQNPDAVDFYERRGFAQTGRSELDADGNPFPILHLARRPDEKDQA
jgi:putative acetyltransferase